MTNFCRLCLQSSPDMLPLFEAVIGEKLLIEIILSTFGVELENSLNFPNQVCQDCFKSVDLLYGFYNKLIETQSLLSQLKKEGEPVVGAMHETNSFNKQENDCETFEHHEKEEISHQNLFVTAEPIDIDENNSAISNNDITELIQEQIEQEPIVIKHELLKSAYEDVVDHEIDQNYDNENNLPKKRTWKRNPKEVQTIPNKCYICGPILDSEDEFHAHLEGHKEMLPYECSQCTTPTNPIVLPTVVLLNKHIETHSFNYICHLCPQRFRAGNTLSYHRRTAHNDPTSKHHCDICGKVFNNAVVLQNHVYTHKYENIQRNKCEKCPKTFISLSGLQRHLQTHTTQEQIEQKAIVIKQNPLKCRGEEVHDDETIQTYDKNNLAKKRRQWKRNPKEVQTVPNKCYICGPILESKVEFLAHLEGHKEMLPYECSQCTTASNPIILPNLDLLNKHIETHSFNYVCHLCPQRFRASNTLSYHRRTVHNDPTSKHHCDFCGRVFNNAVALQNHVYTHKYENMQRYKCKNCPKTFFSLSGLQRHLQIHTTHEQIEQEAIVIKQDHLECDDEEKIQNYDKNNLRKKKKNNNIAIKRKWKRNPKEVQIVRNKCYICGPIFESEVEFLAHLEGHKEMLPYECSQCTTPTNPIILPNVVILNKHFVTHSFNYICPLCPQRFRASNALSYHRRTVHSESTSEHHCEICGKVFSNVVMLQYHVYGHKYASMQRYKCENCPKTFKSLAGRQRHLQTHTTQEQIEQGIVFIEPDPLECDDEEVDDDETTQNYDNKNNLSKKRRESKENPKEVQTIFNKCYICGPILESEDEFLAHLEGHKEMLPYECSQCTTATNPIILSTVVLLNKHIETHSFNYICHLCPQRFRASNALSYHQRTVHEKQASKHCCDSCGKVFYNSVLFRSHIRDHSNLDTQRYKCETCQKLFKGLFSLRRHELIHTKRDGRYVCKWCDSATFHTVVCCLKHMERCKANKKRKEKVKAIDSAS